MFPITEDKFLLKFLGKPLLQHQIELALKAGLKDFVIIGNPFNIEKIKEVCRGLKGNFEFAIQKEPKGMADAVLSGKKFLGEEFLVINPNDIFELTAYQRILEAFRKFQCDAYIIGYKVKSYFPGGYLEMNEDGELIRIHEKPGEGNEPSDLINIVIHLHRNFEDFLKYLEKTKSKKDDVYECAITRMAQDGYKVKVVMYDGFWKAIKYPWHIFDVMEFFLDRVERPRVSNTSKISEKANIYGNVIIEDNVRILENATIRGPCYIGRNTLIGNNALIWNKSHIGDNCVIGFSSEIKHSYICDNCWFHMSYIGDSIISENCSFGAGTITANFRFDEKEVKVNVKGERISTDRIKFGAIVGKNSKTGVNSCLMPGVKVGPNSIVGPGVTLMHDLEPNKIILVKEDSFIIKENKIKIKDEKKELLEKLLKKV